MSSSSDINLLQSKTVLPPQLAAIEGRLRQASYMSLAILLVAGVLVGVTYLFFQNQKRVLEETRTQLIRKINAQSQKEGFLVAVRERLGVVDKVLAYQLPWAQIMDTIKTIALPPKLNAISVEEQNKVTLSVKADSIEETLNMVNAIVAGVEQKKLRNPQLVSFQLEKDGSVQLMFSFVPLFARL